MSSIFKRFFMLIILLIALCIPDIAFAQEWHPTNQVTIAWEGAANATGYKVYTKSVDGTNVVEVGMTALLNYTITFIEEGRYFLGVKSIRNIDGELLTSDIAWSDSAEACQNSETFGAVYYEPPEAVTNLRIE